MLRSAVASVVAALALAVAAATAGAATAVGPIPGTWGGTVTATNGEAVTIDISTQIPEDPALQLQWADFITSLVHGAEIATVTVVIAPLRQVRNTCGRSALACYLGQTKTLYAPADDVPDEATAKSIVAHEYGHHVANSATNTPWPTIDWGTKRWATAMNICSRVTGGQLYPGDEGRNYLYNPGEAFAESYRVLNEQLLALTPTPWNIVDPSLQPSAAALDALRLDVISPWLAPRLATRTGSFGKASKAKTKTFTIATPLDGNVAVSVKSARTGIYRAKASTTSVCGQRTVAVTVTRVRGFGAFTLTVSAP
jgi:hypothetical protein